MDPLSEILSSVRLVSSVWSTARLTEPWSVRTTGAPGAIFHAIVRGSATLELGGGQEPVHLTAGKLVLLPRGDGHVLSDAPARLPERLRDLIPAATPDDPIPCLVHGGDGPETFIICGSFRMDHVAGGTFLGLLPRILHVDPDGLQLTRWFESTLELMKAEALSGRPGADSVLTRLADVLFVQVLRASLSALPDENAGWLAALRDDRIGRALALLHGQPAEDWSVDELARRVAMSRSSFVERFSSLVGDPPLRYLSRWRVQTAADMLRRSDVSVSELAGRVGYRSGDAFSRAFKKHTGLTPRRYRAQAEAPPV